MDKVNSDIFYEWHMPDGHWQLFTDGTLSLQGTGRLSGDAFRGFQEKITRIEVRGYHTVGEGIFSFLPFLKEAILDPSVTVIEEKAFYCCAQLQDASMGREVDIAYDAFHGTPLQHECLTEAEIEEFEKAVGPYRRDLLAAPLERTMKYQDFWDKVDFCLYRFEHSLATESELTSGVQSLLQAAEEGEPASMYLWAEFLLWGSFTADKQFGNDFLEIMPDNEEVRRASKQFTHSNSSVRILLNDPDEDGCIWNAPDAYKWYAKSAKAGYLPAISWLAWCAKRGIVTKPSEEESRRWIAYAEKFPPASTLLPKDLNKFVEGAVDLGHAAYDADLEEDIAFDRGYDAPWPTWKDLLSASMITYKLGCMFGSPRCALPIHELQAYDYETCDSLERRRMCVEKRMWQIWSGLNGIGVEKASKEHLLSWLTDIDRAVDYGEYSKRHMNLDKNTEELIRTFKEEVQQLHD